MRVLALTNLYPSPWRPHRAPFNRQQLAALASEHEVRIIAPVAWTDEWRGRARASGSEPFARGRLCDGMVVDHPRYAFPPKILRGAYGRFLVSSVRRPFEQAVGEFRPDVVLGCWAYPDGWAAATLAREAGLPVVIKVHGSDVLTVDGHPARRRRTVEALGAADGVVLVSGELAERVRTLGVSPARSHLVYNGVDQSLFCPGGRDTARGALGLELGERLLLFVGNLVPVKGPDVLIAALATAAARGLKFRCALVGDGPMRRALERSARTSGLSGRVRFVGARPLAELPTWYRAADVLVVPSRSEGVPNVMLESASCGTPVIAAAVGGVPELALPESLVAPGDVRLLAERICGALAGSIPPASLRVMPGSWLDSARQLAAVLRTVIQAAQKPRSRAA